jgi:sRNA-binding protein
MTNKSDWRRAAQDSWQAFDLLRARWPKAFPAKPYEVRPLVNVTAELQEAFGWSPAYAKGVLSVWKARDAYCRAVLRYPNRIALDGSLTEKTVDDKAREMASARLEQIAIKKAKAAERRALEAADRAAAEATAPPREPEPAPAPTAPVEVPAPEPERPRARKLLTISPAAKEALAKRGLGTTEVVATIQRRAR